MSAKLAQYPGQRLPGNIIGGMRPLAVVVLGCGPLPTEEAANLELAAVMLLQHCYQTKLP